ncbi:c-type cytochrome [Hymenobacter jeollabukensis]|uniref:Cytochrome c n=1 Tax=Hymenobacter jeollabukensis TaxID=2025313 RepID=A0A5R8WWV9_9BACT|nr:cytochrome c [Hymenobacter jeollabukensis]TLM96998.1 cytochrome c [Hymenobacter jeollabukensis]
MSRNALTLVFPAAVALLVCSLVVLFLTATGLEPGPASDEPLAAATADSVRRATTPGNDSLYLASLNLSAADAEAIAAGDALFKSNCAQCHAVNDVVVGPALAGIDKRRPMPWLIKWVKNSSKVVASGDEYAVKLFNQYQKQQMPSFSLTDQEIERIVKYVSSPGSCLPPRGTDDAVAVN